MLLHDSRRRWRTLRAEGHEWRDENRALEAFERSRPPGGVISMRGTPGPTRDGEPLWQLSICQPDRSRVEFGVSHDRRIAQITDGGRTWRTAPGGHGHVNEQRNGAKLQLGPLGLLVETAEISAALELEVAEPTRALGRKAFEVRARPRDRELRPRPGLFNPHMLGADHVQLVVDAERGVLLRVETFLGGEPFYRLEMTEVSFDEDIPDAVFAFPTDDSRLTVAGGPQPSSLAPMPRTRRMIHEGPPDNILGHSAPVEAVLVRTESIVIAVDRVVGYPSGFELHLTVRTSDEHLPGTTEPAYPRAWSGSAAFLGESLRFGVAFSDGRRTFVDNLRRVVGQPELALIPVSGSGTAARFDQRFWVRPLPPKGPIGFLAQWTRRGVEETRVDVPADAILEAAGQSTVLWETR